MDRREANIILLEIMKKYSFTPREGLALALCVLPGAECNCVGSAISRRRLDEINEVENGSST
jgi:hypothetical protein